MAFETNQARQNMIEGQLRPNKVSHPALLAAMETLPREDFVTTAHRPLAYSEREVAASPARNLLAPMVLARMIESLAIQPIDRVLDVAPASGYSTAVLASLARSVVGLEADAGLVTLAGKNLTAQKISNAVMMHGPISMGAKNHAPYNAILINGAMAAVPRTLFNQLAEGGRLVAVIGGESGIRTGVATLYTKFHNSISARPLFEAAASTLPGFAPEEVFAL